MIENKKIKIEKNFKLYFKQRDKRSIAEKLYILEFGKKNKLTAAQLKQKPRTRKQKFKQLKKNLSRHLRKQGYILRL